MKKVTKHLNRGKFPYTVMTDNYNREEEYCLCHNECRKFKARRGCSIRQKIIRLALVLGIVPVIWECRSYEESAADQQLKFNSDKLKGR